MTQSQKKHWQMIGIGVLAVVLGAFFMWYGIERLDRAILKYRQIGKIAGAGVVILVGFYIIVQQIRKTPKSQ